MIKQISTPDAARGHLSGFRLSGIIFDATRMRFDHLIPVWDALENGQCKAARQTALELLTEPVKRSNEERAALKIALASAELQLGALDAAKRHAGRAIDLFPRQFAGHRILLHILTARKDFAAAYLHLLNLPIPSRLARWDDAIPSSEMELALASWAWQLGEWDQVSDHLTRAYPSGVSEMPAEIREDWFRLSLYRGHPDDAAAVAALLIEQASAEHVDEVLQTIVNSGWTKQALPLYRSAFNSWPSSELLRRRLVALCIREGQLDEARVLASGGALRTAA